MSLPAWHVRIGTVDEFFADGRRIARAANRGESIPENYSLTFEDPEDLAEWLRQGSLKNLDRPEPR
jgi:predicted transcriptional regulator